jgi:acetyl esterase/lipase
MIVAGLRWALLSFALFSVACGLLTTVIAPDWIDWRIRMVLGLIVAEAGLWLSLLPLAVAVAAWFLRRGSPPAAAVTIACCLLAATLMIKPAFQASRLSRALPGELAKSFGPAQPRQTPFFMTPKFHGTLPEAPVRTMRYSGSQRLDFYRAAGGSPAPCVIVLHGGGWYSGNRQESTWFDHRLAQLGYAVAAIDYRLAPAATWPAQRDDVVAAVAFLRAQAAELGIDPQRLVLLGRSAGGQLALATAYGQRDSGIRGVIAFYAPSDLAGPFDAGSRSDVQIRKMIERFMGGTPAEIPAAYQSASAQRLAVAGATPTLLLHGELDSLVSSSESELLGEKLGSLGVPHAVVLLPWATHGFDFARNGPGDRLASYAIEWFLSAVTR